MSFLRSVRAAPFTTQSITGHDLIPDILVAYTKKQIRTVWSFAHGKAFNSAPVHKPGDSRDGQILSGGVVKERRSRAQLKERQRN